METGNVSKKQQLDQTEKHSQRPPMGVQRRKKFPHWDSGFNTTQEYN